MIVYFIPAGNTVFSITGVWMFASLHFEQFTYQTFISLTVFRSIQDRLIITNMIRVIADATLCFLLCFFFWFETFIDTDVWSKGFNSE